MKYALIGCGRIATNHIKAVLNNHLELAAVCDVLPQQMENLLAKHELQNDSSIWADAYDKKVIISSPTNLFALRSFRGSMPCFRRARRVRGFFVAQKVKGSSLCRLGYTGHVPNALDGLGRRHVPNLVRSGRKQP